MRYLVRPRHGVEREKNGTTDIRQIAALPYRTDKCGIIEVLLITSRETRRWVVPKGNLIKGLTAHAAAAHEAFEEAGVIGNVSRRPVGSFEYMKQGSSGRSRRVTVRLFALAVSRLADEWPEKSQRELRWFSLPEAAEAVLEPDLKVLIDTFERPDSFTSGPDQSG